MIMDDEQRTRKTENFPKKLDTLSVHELEAYIVELETELERVTAEIKRKDAHKSAADALFGKK